MNELPVSQIANKDRIALAEDIIKHTPGAMHGDCFPLKHTFGDGLYIREIFMPKGHFVVSKIHKMEHPYFIMSGRVSVLTKEGVLRINAPFNGITKAGTKRLLYTHEDTVWITVHKTDKKDIAEIEKEIIAESFESIGEDEPMAIEFSKIITGNCLVAALAEKDRDFFSLLELKAYDTMLPFKEAIANLKKHSISMEGIYAVKIADNIWHATTDSENAQPITDIELTDADLVGTYGAWALGVSIVGTAISGYSSYSAGQARQKQADWSGLVARRNADLAAQRQELQKTQTRIAEKQHKDKVKRAILSARTLYGKSGAVSDKGTPLLVMEDMAADAALDAITIRIAGSAEEARIVAEQAGLKSQSTLATMRGKAASAAGTTGAGSALLSGVGKFVQYNADTSKPKDG